MADFLVEFSIVLHKRAMYPLGHPHLQESTARFVNRLESLLAPRDSLAIGVARHQLIVAGTATDPRNALLSDLARRLHRHRIATLRFERGISLQEIDDLLAGPRGRPAGRRRAVRPPARRGRRRGSHLKVQPPELSRMFLQDDERPTTTRPRRRPARSGWGSPTWRCRPTASPGDTRRIRCSSPGRSTRSPSRSAYDRVVLDYLGQIADEMSGRQGAWEPRVRERVSRLVTSLKPETLRRVLEAGADHAERRRFALTAAEVLAVDAVIEVVEAAAATTGQTISHQLLRLLNKFAHHAEQGPEQRRAEAESTLRRNVAQLITDWNLEDPNPGEYTAVLDGMVRQAARRRRPDGGGPARLRAGLMLQIALETDCGGPRVYAALETLVGARRITEAVARAPRRAAGPRNATADALWRHLATPARLRARARRAATRLPTIESLVSRLGARRRRARCSTCSSRPPTAPSAAAPSGCWSRSARPVAPAAAARLKDAPWFVQRNLLALLRTLQDLARRLLGGHATRATRSPASAARPTSCCSSFPSIGPRPSCTGSRTRIPRSSRSCCAPPWRTARPRPCAPSSDSPTTGAARPSFGRSRCARWAARTGPRRWPSLLELAGARRHFFGWRIDAKSPVVLAAVVGARPELRRGTRRSPACSRPRATTSDPDIRLAARMRSA